MVTNFPYLVAIAKILLVWVENTRLFSYKILCVIIVLISLLNILYYSNNYHGIDPNEKSKEKMIDIL